MCQFRGDKKICYLFMVVLLVIGAVITLSLYFGYRRTMKELHILDYLSVGKVDSDYLGVGDFLEYNGTTLSAPDIESNSLETNRITSTGLHVKDFIATGDVHSNRGYTTDGYLKSKSISVSSSADLNNVKVSGVITGNTASFSNIAGGNIDFSSAKFKVIETNELILDDDVEFKQVYSDLYLGGEAIFDNISVHNITADNFYADDIIVDQLDLNVLNVSHASLFNLYIDSGVGEELHMNVLSALDFTSPSCSLGDVVADDISITGSITGGTIDNDGITTDTIVANLGATLGGTTSTFNLEAFTLNAGTIDVDLGVIVGASLNIGDELIVSNDITAGGTIEGNNLDIDTQATVANLLVQGISSSTIIEGNTITQGDVSVGNDLYLDGNIYIDPTNPSWQPDLCRPTQFVSVDYDITFLGAPFSLTHSTTLEIQRCDNKMYLRLAGIDFLSVYGKTAVSLDIIQTSGSTFCDDMPSDSNLLVVARASALETRILIHLGGCTWTDPSFLGEGIRENHLTFLI